MLMWVTWKSDSLSRSQHGFTLLELLVVIVLLGLVAGIVAPRFIEMGGGLAKRTTCWRCVSVLMVYRYWPCAVVSHCVSTVMAHR